MLIQCLAYFLISHTPLLTSTPVASADQLPAPRLRPGEPLRSDSRLKPLSFDSAVRGALILNCRMREST